MVILAVLVSMLPAVSSDGADGTARYTADGKRIICLGTWFDHYYVSKHTSIYDNPRLQDPVNAQLMLDNVRAIEEKYNIVLEYANMTFQGIQESISTSIMAGAPDADVYLVDLQFGIPAALSGMGISLETLGLKDSDVFTDQNVMKYLDIAGIDEHVLFASSLTSVDCYPLAFNMNLIREANLENPQDLYDRGEWTWDKWREYMVALTKDTNGDGAIDVYGWSGYWTNMLSNLLFSNSTGIAMSPEETLTATATIEVLELINTIYNVDKTGRPWDQSNWEINNKLYAEGKSGFWIGAHWIFDEFGGAELPFEIGVVPWPRGPHGDEDTRYHNNTAGNWYMIPKGVQDPELVYNVIYDWTNWYQGDRSIAEDLNWAMDRFMTDRNFDYVLMMSKRAGFDIWGSLGLGDGFSMVPLMDGEKTPSQIAEEAKQLVQDALDNYFK
jgi:ABC-type glycerol-3-phosphate transport system substrate-binding protein